MRSIQDYSTSISVLPRRLLSDTPTVVWHRMVREPSPMFLRPPKVRINHPRTIRTTRARAGVVRVQVVAGLVADAEALEAAVLAVGEEAVLEAAVVAEAVAAATAQRRARVT